MVGVRDGSLELPVMGLWVYPFPIRPFRKIFIDLQTKKA